MLTQKFVELRYPFIGFEAGRGAVGPRNHYVVLTKGVNRNFVRVSGMKGSNYRRRK